MIKELQHQSLLAPEENKFHKGNGSDGKHYWLTPPDLYAVTENTVADKCLIRHTDVSD